MRDPHRQAIETFDNLTTLVVHAASRVNAPLALADPLDALSDLRVYFVHDAQAALVRDLVLARFPSAKRIEFTRADLCRTELLVEIEGLARF